MHGKSPPTGIAIIPESRPYGWGTELVGRLPSAPVSTAPAVPNGSMPDPALRRPRWAWWGLTAALTTLMLLTAAVVTGGDVLAGFDEAVTSFTRGWADPLGWPVDLAHTIGTLTSPIRSAILCTVVVVLLATLGRRAAAAFLALSAISGVAMTEALKLGIGRQRPPGAEQYEPDLDKSFPSGHTSSGIYLYLALGLVLLRIGSARGTPTLVGLGWALIGFGPALGLTRLVLGVHWPSDVLAGWAIGSLAALAAALLLWAPLHRGWAGRPGAPPHPPLAPAGQ